MSWETSPRADNGSPDIFENRLIFQERLEQGYKPNTGMNILFVTYNDNRVFRYEVGFSRLSPIY